MQYSENQPSSRVVLRELSQVLGLKFSALAYKMAYNMVHNMVHNMAHHWDYNWVHHWDYNLANNMILKL